MSLRPLKVSATAVLFPYFVSLFTARPLPLAGLHSPEQSTQKRAESQRKEKDRRGEVGRKTEKKERKRRRERCGGDEGAGDSCVPREPAAVKNPPRFAPLGVASTSVLFVYELQSSFLLLHHACAISCS